jgi:hypothetical protein
MTDTYSDVKSFYENSDEVIVNSGRGAQGLKLGKKMFVMFYKGNLLAVLSPERVGELVNSGKGLSHDPGTGTIMKDRVVIPPEFKDLWIDICEESRKYSLSR